ncbi:MAG: hypothetical protein QXF32_02220 [Candidatus Thermoplasmatota archaeon]
MEVEIETREGKKKVEIREDASGGDLLSLLGILPDSCLIVVDGKPVPYNERIRGKKIKIINVATGG